MVKRAIVRNSNFITPYNRPWEYNTDSSPINIQTYAGKISKLWPNFDDLRDTEHGEGILYQLEDANWTVTTSRF